MRYEKKRDQRELIKVAQRNFRKDMALRGWGWFVIIQKTRPMIGRPDPNEELRLLEEKANATYGVYKEKIDLKAKLLEENKAIEAEKKALIKQIESEQGNIGQYHERQALVSSQKADLEVVSASYNDTKGLFLELISRMKDDRKVSEESLTFPISHQKYVWYFRVRKT